MTKLNTLGLIRPSVQERYLPFRPLPHCHARQGTLELIWTIRHKFRVHKMCVTLRALFIINSEYLFLKQI